MSRYANRFSMDAVRLFWDGVADEYGKENDRVEDIHTQRFREACKRLALRAGMRVLNVWSRTGSAVPYLREACADIVIINAELSRGMLHQAALLHPGENYVQSSLHELPFGPSSFDAVLSLETLEHVPDPLVFLTEVRRVLVPGGDLVMSLPPSAAEWTSSLNSLFRFHHGEGPHRFLAPGEVKRMLDDAGFELLEHRGTLFVPFNGSFFEWVDARLSALFAEGPLAQLGIRQFYVCKAPR